MPAREVVSLRITHSDPPHWNLYLVLKRKCPRQESFTQVWCSLRDWSCWLWKGTIWMLWTYNISNQQSTSMILTIQGETTRQRRYLICSTTLKRLARLPRNMMSSTLCQDLQTQTSLWRLTCTICSHLKVWGISYFKTLERRALFASQRRINGLLLI